MVGSGKGSVADGKYNRPDQTILNHGARLVGGGFKLYRW